MNRKLSNLGPALFMALIMLIASALAVASRHAPWAAAAAVLLLVLAPVGTDLVLRRRAGLRPVPSATVLLLSAMVLVACGLVASRGLRELVEMIPIFGSCAAMPFILRRGRSTKCSLA